LLAGLRAAPIQDSETPIPPLPGWTAERLAELSEERSRTVRESDVVVVGDPEALRYAGDPAAPDLSDPPSALPTEAAASAIEHALAVVLKRDQARLRKRAAVSAPTPPADPFVRLSSRAMIREVARRQASRLRRGAR
jgi:hypothetical protein